MLSVKVITPHDIKDVAAKQQVTFEFVSNLTFLVEFVIVMPPSQLLFVV